MNLADFLLENSDNSKIAIVVNETNYTYGDLKKAIIQLGKGLRTIGVRHSDRIGILGGNSFFWIASYLAILRIGCVAVPISTIIKPDELSINLDVSGCKALCIDNAYQKKFGAKINVPTITENHLSGYESVYKGEWGYSEFFDDSIDSALMFTSGTVSKPRMVRVTAKNIQANTSSIVECLGLNEFDRMMVVLPFYYCYGTSLLHTHLRVGGTLILGANLVYPEQLLDLMELKKSTGFAGVPSTYQNLLRNTTFATRNFASLKNLQQAGGKLHETLINEILNSKSNFNLNIMYGQTEATARLSCLPPGLVTEKMGSIGKGIPGVELRVMNEFGELISPGETGEIIASGENISPGYYNDVEATSQKFVDGVLRTGDIATIDKDGYIYIVGRKSDFIKSYGNRVSSQEIESATLEIKDILSAAAIGVPDIERGEAIILFVTTKANSFVTPNDVMSQLKLRFPIFKIPSKVILINDMPHNSNGKIDKQALRELFESKTFQQ